jgi:glutamate racemase
LPHEATLYLADSAYCPYGARPIDEIIARARAIARFLQDQACKLIVVACNTASAAALETLRAEFDVPLVGLEPALKPAAKASKTGHVGVLATAGTIQGNLFQNTTRRHANGIQVHIQIGEGLVEQVEAGQLDTPDTERLLHQYLDPMLAAGVDQIVLGCTHYPLLMPLIHCIVNDQAEVIDPAQAIARQIERLLISQNTLRSAELETTASRIPQHIFYTTGQPRTFQFNNAETCPVYEQPIFFKPISLAEPSQGK